MTQLSTTAGFLASVNEDMPPQDLDELLRQIWRLLQRGVGDGRSAFHTPGIATQSLDGGASLRTVVLRAAQSDPPRLLCHTDARSGKVAELQANDRVAWLFYDARKKVQLRINARAELHRDDDLARRQWQRTGLWSRRCYCSTAAPGSELSGPGSGLPPELEQRAPEQQESEAGRDNFVVVSCAVLSIDWLWLSARGHRRADFRWSEREGRLVGRWTVP